MRTTVDLSIYLSLYCVYYMYMYMYTYIYIYIYIIATPRHAIAPPLGHPALPARASGVDMSRHDESKAIWKPWETVGKPWENHGEMEVYSG